MIEQFLSAYQTWPPAEQLKFAVIAICIGAGLALCFGLWGVGLCKDFMFYCSVWWRGWPEYQEHVGGLLPPPPQRPEMPQRHPLATFRVLLAKLTQPGDTKPPESLPEIIDARTSDAANDSRLPPGSPLPRP